MSVSPEPENTGLIVMDEAATPMSVSVGTHDFYHATNKVNEGSYIVEVRAFTDNDTDTGYSQ